MNLDFSEKGREEFYRDIGNKVEKLSKNDGDISTRYNIAINYLNNLLGYEHQRKMYNEQVKILWNLKKNQLILMNYDIQTFGVLKLETQERGDFIKKHEEILKRMSSSFKEDLEKMIRSDPDVRNIDINPN